MSPLIFMEQLILYFKNKGIPSEELDELVNIADGDESFFRRITQRRLLREPLAYIRGYATFYGRKFDVDKRVYVPNPETENLVRLLLDDLGAQSSVLDIGTGCGSIAITAKLERPNSKVYGCDINPSALEVARANARRHKVDISFFESFYVDDLAIDAPTHIIADMPWGNETNILGTDDLLELHHMPQEAVFHPKGVLESYRELITSIQKKNWKPALFFESGRVGESHVRDIIPEGLNVQYVPFDNYSVTVVRF